MLPGQRFDLTLVGFGNTWHSVPLDAGEIRWRRLAGGLEARLALRFRLLDVRTGPLGVASCIDAQGKGYSEDLSERAVDMALGWGVSASLGRDWIVSPVLDVLTLYWVGRHTVELDGSTVRRDLPQGQILVTVGTRFDFLH